MSGHWLTQVRRQILAQDAARQVTAGEEEKLGPSEARLLSAVAPRSASESKLYLGRLAAGGRPVDLGLSHLVGVAEWTVGATGSGKSVLAFSKIMQYLLLPLSLIVLDGKFELIPWLVADLLPAVLAGLGEGERESFLASYQVVSPLDPENLPEFNVLCPLPGVERSLQAKELSMLVSESLGPASGMGSRMETILGYALRLALDVGGLSFLEVRSALANRAYLDRLLAFVRDEEVRQFFCFRFGKENESLHALLSRLDNLLLLDDTKRVLCARSSLDPASWLEGRATLLSVGNPPRGAEFLSRFWMGVFVRGLARAILSRPLTPTSLPVFALLDEFWVGLDSDLAEHFERLLTLCRYKKVSLGLYHQLASQIGTKFPGLLATLKNSCGVHCLFRQSYEDARAFEHVLPITGTRQVRRHDGPRWEVKIATPEEERRLAVADFSRLRDRHFYYVFRKLGLEGVELVSPTVDFKGIRRAAAAAPSEIREAALGHRPGASRAERDRVLEQRRAQMAKVAAGLAETGGPTWEERPLEVFFSPPPAVRVTKERPVEVPLVGEAVRAPRDATPAPPNSAGERAPTVPADPADSASVFFLG